MTSAEVRQPSATCSIASFDTTPGDVAIAIAVGGPTQAIVTAQDAADNVHGEYAIDVLDNGIVQHLAQMQTAMFKPRTAEDSFVNLYDGKAGHMLLFNGYLSNPAYNSMPGSVGDVFTVAHPLMVLSGYRPYIYASPLLERGAAIYQDFDSPCMSERFIQVLKSMRDRWIPFSKAGATTMVSEQTLALYAVIHQQNEMIFPMLEKIFMSEESKAGTTWKNLDAFVADTKRNANISLFMEATILQQTGNFLENIASFESAFQTVLVPNVATSLSELAEPPGHFCSWADAVGYTSEQHTLEVTEIQFSGGNRGYLPVCNVMVYGQVSDQFRKGNQYGIPCTTPAIWPTVDYAGGRSLITYGPPWVGPISTTTGEVTEQPVFQADAGRDLAIAAKRIVAAHALVAKISDKVVHPVLQEWAKNLYEFSSLQSAVGNIMIPMDTSIKPGYRYNVCNKTDKLFSGFLVSASHRLTSYGGRGKATTNLTFTHVKTEGFELP